MFQVFLTEKGTNFGKRRLLELVPFSCIVIDNKKELEIPSSFLIKF